MKSCSVIALLLAILPCRLLLAERIHPLDLLDVPSSTIATRWSPLAGQPGGLDSLVLSNGSCFLASRISPSIVDAWVADDSAAESKTDAETDSVATTDERPDLLVTIVAIEGAGQGRDQAQLLDLCATLPPASREKPSHFLVVQIDGSHYAEPPCLFATLLEEVNGQLVALEATSVSRRSTQGENAGIGP